MSKKIKNRFILFDNNYNHSIIDCNAMVLLNQVEKGNYYNLSENICDDIGNKINRKL